MAIPALGRIVDGDKDCLATGAMKIQPIAWTHHMSLDPSKVQKRKESWVT